MTTAPVSVAPSEWAVIRNPSQERTHALQQKSDARTLPTTPSKIGLPQCRSQMIRTSRATVAERVIFVTRKSLKSKMPPHINSPGAKFMPSPSSCDGFEAETG